MNRDEILAVASDALAGWRYIRQHHGDLYGVGWDRVEHGLADLHARLSAREAQPVGEDGLTDAEREAGEIWTRGYKNALANIVEAQPVAGDMVMVSRQQIERVASSIDALVLVRTNDPTLSEHVGDEINRMLTASQQQEEKDVG